MGNPINIDWSAGSNMNPQGPLGVVNQGYAGAEEGYKLGQAAAVRHALNGLNLDDPTSVNSAISGLVKAGAGEQGNALMGLNASRQIYSSVIPYVAKKLQQQGQAAQTTTSAAPDASAPPVDQAAVDQKHSEIMGQAQQAVTQLQALPLSERPAAAAQIREQFVQHGVPPAAIDGHLDDLSDAGLAQTGKYFSDHGAWMQSQAAPGATPTAAPQHPTGFAWANDLMNDPVMNDPMVVAAMKRVGFDPTETMNRAQALNAPWNAAAAQTAYVAPQEEAKKAVDLAFSIPEAMVAARKAGMVATADVAARSPGEFLTVKGPNGQDVYVRKDYAMGYADSHGGVLGQGIAPAEQSFRTTQAGQAADLLKPDPAARNAASDSLASAERAQSIISTMKFDQATPVKAQIASALRTAGFKDADKYANDVAGYNQTTTQALVQGAHSAFPSRVTDRDIKLMHDIYPTLTTPNAAASVAMGTQAAQALRTQQFEDFKANYTGPHESPGDIQKAWLAGPGGQSILQSPEWSKINIGGRPAFNPTTDIKTVKGQKVGAWGIGTGHPVYFAVH